MKKYTLLLLLCISSLVSMGQDYSRRGIAPIPLYLQNPAGVRHPCIVDTGTYLYMKGCDNYADSVDGYVTVQWFISNNAGLPLDSGTNVLSGEDYDMWDKSAYALYLWLCSEIDVDPL